MHRKLCATAPSQMFELSLARVRAYSCFWSRTGRISDFIASFTDVDPPFLYTQLTTNKSEISFGYTTLGTLDGMNLTDNNARIELDTYYYPYGEYDFLVAWRGTFPNDPAPAGPLNSQFLSFYLTGALSFHILAFLRPRYFVAFAV